MKKLKSIFILTTTVFFSFYACKKELKTDHALNAVKIDESISTATFSVGGVLGSNMVVQRDKPFLVWGTAITGHTIMVNASWNASTFTTTAASAGRWQVSIPAAAANNTVQTLTIKDNGAVAASFTNILIGEVWVCSGQSNMYMPVDSTTSWPGYEGVLNYKEEIAKANYPLLRLIEIQQDYSPMPVNDIAFQASWSVCSPESVKAYSAVAYFFGRKLLTSLNVPVGLVVSSVGGTSCEAWTSKLALQSDPVLDAYYSGRNNSSKLFNGMIYPLRNLSIKGFTWYQGESNRNDKPVSNYTKLNSLMIENWRQTFNQGELPFYLVQMTPYDQDFLTGSSKKDNDYAFFREAQAGVRIVSNTGMAITMDVGSIKRIHPRNKKPVGERLALLALNKTYNNPLQCLGPQYLSFTTNNLKATINFVPGTANGLNTINNEPINQFFFVAGTDKTFRKATAVISGNQIIVTAPANTPLPIQAVRYAFTNYPITNLQNSDGLPMEPFRTDSW